MPALDGIRITDFTTMVNGSFTTRLLADMGADVIKIEAPDGDPWRNWGIAFLSSNRGKRSMSIDLKRPEAREIARKLIARSDVFAENARPGVWRRLGLDYESVAKMKPDIIYVSILGYGSEGPSSSWPAYDQVMQTRSGQAVGQGGLGKPPVIHRVVINDQSGPMLAAYGVVLALLERAKTGRGQHVETSLTNASIAIQSGSFIDYPGMVHEYPGDTDIRGLNATQRHYQAGDDRWLFLLCTDELQWRSACQVLGLEALLSDTRFETAEERAGNDEALVEILSAAFRTRPSADWIAALRQADVPVALGQTIDEVLRDPHFLQSGVFDHEQHAEFGKVQLVGVTPKFSEMAGVIRRPVPRLGEHTEELLIELGYARDDIAELISDKIVFAAKASD